MPALGEDEVKAQLHRAAGKVACDVGACNVCAVAAADIADGVGDPGNLTAPGADRVHAVVLSSLVLDGGGRVELREVGVGVGQWREAEIALDQWFIDTNLLPPVGGESTGRIETAGVRAGTPAVTHV